MEKARRLCEAGWGKGKQGDLAGAVREADIGLSLYPDVQSESHWRFRTLKAEMLMRQGFYEDALALLRVDIPTDLAQTDSAVWLKLTEGAALGYLGRYAEASDALERAQSLAQSTVPQLLGEVFLRRGTLASLQWRLSEARANYRETLDLAKEHRDPFLETAALGSLGVVAARMEHYDEAVDWNKQAFELSKSTGDLRSVSKIEGNIGWNQYLLGDFVSALENYSQAEKDAIQAGLNHEKVLWLTNLGVTHFAQQDYDSALSESQEAMRLARQLGDPADIIECLQNLSEVRIQKGLYSEAEAELEEVTQRSKSVPDIKRDLYTELLAGHLASKAKNLDSAGEIYTKILRSAEVPTSLRWEAQAGLAEVQAAQGKSSLAERGFNDSVSTIIKAWDALPREDFRLSFLSSAIRFYDAYVNFLIEQKRPVDALKIADRSRAQTLEHGLSPESEGNSGGRGQIHPQEIAQKWNATVLFYWLGEQRSHLWVITPTKVSLLPLPARSEIDARVKSYLDAFADPRDPLETGNADGKKLYETLIEPAEKLIPRSSRVIILPDGGLNSLNFETLIVPGAKPHYWIEDITLFTGNSLALLAKASPAAPPADASLFLMGDALQASPDFPSLPQAGKEVGLVEKYFPAGRRLVLTRAQATPSGFLSAKPEEFSYLHFATHGTASTLRPQESAVILSPEGDAYKLYARDIVQHPVHAYLVTISACNGAGMKTYAGEGLVGLAWAFLRAGAHNVIGGLWEVSNASTPQLMDELYKGLNDGMDPATALRNAKLTLVHSTGNYHRPFYWAPFQLYAGS